MNTEIPTNNKIVIIYKIGYGGVDSYYGEVVEKEFSKAYAIRSFKSGHFDGTKKKN